MTKPGADKPHGLRELSAEQYRRVAHWRKRICAAWQKHVEAILNIGRLLDEARNDLADVHGGWTSMVKNDLPFGISTATRLMVIARNETTKTRDTVTRVASDLGVSLRQRRNRHNYHCACPPYDDPDKDCVGFQCHQLTDQQKSVVLDALRDEPRLAHIFSMGVWTDHDHIEILERVDAYLGQRHDEQAINVRRLLEHPHD
jgi:hypothetical protein